MFPYLVASAFKNDLHKKIPKENLKGSYKYVLQLMKNVL